MTLETRPPTGLPAYPLILLDGEEKSGKSYRALELSASPHVGRTFAFDLGDGVADEYARLGPYEVVKLNGTYTNLKAQIHEAIAEPRVEPDKPNVGVLDSGDQLWNILKDEASNRARNSKANRAKLAEDPDAYIDVTSNYWNDAADRWHGIINPMLRSDMVWVITAQGGYVTKFQGGQPVAGQEEWSTQAQKTLPARVNVWIKLRTDGLTARVVGVRSLELKIPRGGLELPQDGALDHLVFDIIGVGGFNHNTSPSMSMGFPKADIMTRLLEGVQVHYSHLTEAEQRAEANRIWKAHTPSPVPDEFNADQVAALMDAVLLGDGGVTAAQAPQDAPVDSGVTPEAPSPTGAQEGGDPGESAPNGEPDPVDPPDPGDPPATMGEVAATDLTEETHAADLLWLTRIEVADLERIAAEVKALTIEEVAVELSTAGRVLPSRSNVATQRQALTALSCRRHLERLAMEASA